MPPNWQPEILSTVEEIWKKYKKLVYLRIYQNDSIVIFLIYKWFSLIQSNSVFVAL